MPNTSDTCQQSGIYTSTCTDRLQIALSTGKKFPPCQTHGDVTWRLVQATRN